MERGLLREILFSKHKILEECALPNAIQEKGILFWNAFVAPNVEQFCSKGKLRSAYLTDTKKVILSWDVSCIFFLLQSRCFVWGVETVHPFNKLHPKRKNSVQLYFCTGFG